MRLFYVKTYILYIQSVCEQETLDRINTFLHDHDSVMSM